MTEAQRKTALTRIATLTERNYHLTTLLNSSEPSAVMEEISAIINENEKTIQDLIKITDKRYEFLFNFVDGGWNSEWAYTIEEAKTLAAQKYSAPKYTGTCVPDMNSFRVSTPDDYKACLSLFH